MGEEKRRKLSRDATTEEIFPGEHGPPQPQVADRLNAVMNGLKEVFGPNYELTLFVAERAPPQGEERMPRFNYISTADRRDMLAVLKAFVAKNEGAWAKLEKIEDEPPTGTPQ